MRLRQRAGTLIFALALLPGVRSASAQTIRPVVSEYQNKAQGKVELVNETDRPMNVVIEPRGFTVNDRGEMQDLPLAASLHLKLSATSFRIPAKQSRLLFYEAASEHAPAWFVLYANFSGYPRREFSGLNVQLELPHLVYILPKTRWIAADVHILSARVDITTHTLVVDLENQGEQFGRLTDVEAHAANRNVHVPGMALFPGVRRRVEIPWTSDQEPDTIVVRSKDFSFERKPPAAGQ